MKIRIQAQHLQPGDIVGSGEIISGITTSSTKFPSSKVLVYLDNEEGKLVRSVLWGKYTMIGIERAEKVIG